MALLLISIFAYVICCSVLGRDFATILFLAGIGYYFLKKTGRTRKEFFNGKVKAICLIVVVVGLLYMIIASIAYHGLAFNAKNIIGIIVVAFDAGVAYHVGRRGIKDLPAKLATVVLLLMLGWLWALMVICSFIVGLKSSGRPIHLDFKAAKKTKKFDSFKFFKGFKVGKKPVRRKSSKKSNQNEEREEIIIDDYEILDSDDNVDDNSDDEYFLDEEDFWEDDEEVFNISDFLRKHRELEEDDDEESETGTVEPTTERPVARTRDIEIPESLPNLDD